MSEITYIGERTSWGEPRLFGLERADRRHHVYMVGKTGLGKTTLLRNLLLQDIHRGEGVGLIDPHGDLAEEILDHIPPHRANDVLYFNPADLEFPIGFNLLRAASEDEGHLVVSTVVAAFKHLWADSWGPRLEYILSNALAALVEQGRSTLVDVLRMLSDERYRARVAQRIKDPVVRRFWQEEFAEYDKRFRVEAVAPVQNKLGRFLASAPLRNILGQARNSLDLGFLMDNQRILIANLSKGTLGEDKAALLGSLLVASFHLAVVQRARTPENERKDFYLYIDEFHNFTTDVFASILSEARKYRLNLTLAHQYLDQLPLETRQAVFGNAGTLISFGVGSTDAEILAPNFSPIGPEALTDLAKYEAYVRLLSDGEVSSPFRAKTLPPLDTYSGQRESLIRRSRERYGRPRASVEEKIARRLRA
ncbi:MAG: type IV secretion system DNA-binding domain-containing protein [Acidobacteria bacterium]|nr:type IV secretion system DNA-binding domain-containing protein [Acidobacteriota bacterium]